MVKVRRRGKSSTGSLRSFSWYIAGMAETKIPPRPPAAVAAVWTMEFSLGPKEPPRIGKFAPKVLLKKVRMANPNMAPNKLAPKVQPVFNPTKRKPEPLEYVCLLVQDIQLSGGGGAVPR